MKCIVFFTERKFYFINFLAPLCPKPPEVPFEGKVENDPIVVELPSSHSCGVDGEVISFYVFYKTLI